MKTMSVEPSPRSNDAEDAAALRILAHPMRIRILGSLRSEGPATSTILAKRLGSDTGQTSFHVRVLHRGGFVEELPDRGNRRERWWQAATLATNWRPLSDYTESEVRTAFSDFERAANSAWSTMLHQYLSDRDSWSKEWVAAAGSYDFWIRLTPEGLTELSDTLREVILKHSLPIDADEEPPDANDVVILLHAFPQRRAPGGKAIQGMYGFERG